MHNHELNIKTTLICHKHSLGDCDFSLVFAQVDDANQGNASGVFESLIYSWPGVV